ncbi:MAG: hypothetical protein ACU0CI_12130 [Shimia sp.]
MTIQDIEQPVETLLRGQREDITVAFGSRVIISDELLTARYFTEVADRAHVYRRGRRLTGNDPQLHPAADASPLKIGAKKQGAA